jgi:hypothetical protein
MKKFLALALFAAVNIPSTSNADLNQNKLIYLSQGVVMIAMEGVILKYAVDYCKYRYKYPQLIKQEMPRNLVLVAAVSAVAYKGLKLAISSYKGYQAETDLENAIRKCKKK